VAQVGKPGQTVWRPPVDRFLGAGCFVYRRAMVTSTAGTVEEYLAALSAERRAAVEEVRRVINANLPAGFEEGMQFGMIGYYVPLSRLPETYNKQPLCLAALASQKGSMSVYLMSVYSSARRRRWFEQEYRKSGKKLDMGKSCVRFKSAGDLPLDLIGKAIAAVGIDEYIADYHASRAGKPAGKSRPTRARSAKTSGAAKPRAATKTGAAGTRSGRGGRRD
jgi:hypothetical protein